jgi:copper oxidase (laccase) domain-containing protein
MAHIEFNNFKKTVVITSLRTDGVSQKKYSSLNLCYLVKDKKLNVDQNREIFFKENCINKDKLIIVSPETCPLYPIIYTRDKTLTIGILHSDTIPLFFESKNKEVFGAMQITRFGTINRYAYNSLKELLQKEKLNPKDVYFYLAPSITFSHNEISARLAYKLFNNGFNGSIKRTDNKYFFDERLMLIKELRLLKVPFKNIYQSEFCTFENSEMFFSKKRKTPTGKMMSVIKAK